MTRDKDRGVVQLHHFEPDAVSNGTEAAGQMSYRGGQATQSQRRNPWSDNMNNMATPAELMRTSMTFWTLMAETQAVMTYRMMGMAGLWAVKKSENNRMVNEKGPAFAEAMLASTRATMAGKRPDQVAMAAMAPLQRKTASNNRRLSRHGPRFQGL